MTSPTDKTRTIRKNKRSAAGRVRKNAVKRNGSTPRLYVLSNAADAPSAPKTPATKA